MNDLQKKIYLYLLLSIVILIWGFSWPMNSIALQYISPILFAEYRLIIGTASMFIFVFSLNKLSIPKKEDLLIIILIGVLQRGLFLMLISLGLNNNSVAHAVMLVYSTPIWVTPISIFMFREKSNFLTWVGLILGMSGLILILAPWQINWEDSKTIIGNVMLLLAAICWAIAMLCTRYMKWTRSPLELAPWQLLAGTITIILLSMFQSHAAAPIWSPSLVGSLLYTGIFATAFAYWGTTVISKELPPSIASLNLLGVPVCGIVFAWLLQHATPSRSIIAAMILIAAGILCTTIKGSSRDIRLDKKLSKNKRLVAKQS